MIEDLRFARADLPRELEIQVLAFMRIVWGDGFPGDERFRTRLWEDERAVHFVRADGDLLVSHAQIVGMDDQQLRVTRITESFSDGLCRFLGAGCGQSKRENREYDRNCALHGGENSTRLAERLCLVCTF